MNFIVKSIQFDNSINSLARAENFEIFKIFNKNFHTEISKFADRILNFAHKKFKI